MRKKATKIKTTSTVIASQPWAMREDNLRALATVAMPDDFDRVSPQTPYRVVNGVALIDLIGPVVKYNDVWTAIFGGFSTIDVQGQLQAAQDDPAVSAVLLAIDSPGGTVAGTGDLAAAVASSTKPTWAYVSDQCCSAAYWIASQADRIVANPTACIGSVGVYSVVEDTSRLYEDAGVKVSVVKAGDSKGVGVDGVPVTPDQLADIQRGIDDVYRLFVGAVATGREMTTADVNKLATGQTWLAAESQALGLIDSVGTIQDAVDELGNSMADVENKVDQPKMVQVAQDVYDRMTADVVSLNDQLKAQQSEAFAAGQSAGIASEKARLDEINALCPDDSAFALEHFKAGTAATDVAKLYIGRLSEKLKQASTLDASNGTSRLNVRSNATAVAGDPEADWAANVGNCRKVYGSLRDYKAYRNWEDRKKK